MVETICKNCDYYGYFEDDSKEGVLIFICTRKIDQSRDPNDQFGFQVEAHNTCKYFKRS